MGRNDLQILIGYSIGLAIGSIPEKDKNEERRKQRNWMLIEQRTRMLARPNGAYY